MESILDELYQDLTGRDEPGTLAASTVAELSHAVKNWVEEHGIWMTLEEICGMTEDLIIRDQQTERGKMMLAKKAVIYNRLWIKGVREEEVYNWLCTQNFQHWVSDVELAARFMSWRNNGNS